MVRLKTNIVYAGKSMLLVILTLRDNIALLRIISPHKEAATLHVVCFTFSEWNFIWALYYIVWGYLLLESRRRWELSALLFVVNVCLNWENVPRNFNLIRLGLFEYEWRILHLRVITNCILWDILICKRIELRLPFSQIKWIVPTDLVPGHIFC